MGQFIDPSMAKPFRFEPNGTTVASKKTLNTKNLEALGAQRLAALLVEVSTANAAVELVDYP